MTFLHHIWRHFKCYKMIFGLQSDHVQLHLTTCCVVHQGDDNDSSDEEWDAHIGRHARAFLGLNEPVAEIPLDDGVGIGTMVKNAFARADRIHHRASTSDGSSGGGPEGSPRHGTRTGNVQAAAGPHSNVRTGDAETATDDQPQLRYSASDTDMHSNSSPMLVSNLSDSTGSLHQPAHEHGEGNLEHEDLEDLEELEEFSDSSDAEDLEDLLGQIPHDRLGTNPETNIATTMPLYEGATLSMLCATLLIVNCCKTHGVSNTFLNELLMLLSMSILPQGNCLPKTEYEATKILRRLGLAYNMIHACPNGCCLFKGALEEHEQCPVCEGPRYKRCGRSRVPTLILRHFPLIP